MLAEYVTLNQNGVVLLPNHLPYEEGATLPCAAVTAWHALIANCGHFVPEEHPETLIQHILTPSVNYLKAIWNLLRKFGHPKV